MVPFYLNEDCKAVLLLEARDGGSPEPGTVWDMEISLHATQGTYSLRGIFVPRNAQNRPAVRSRQPAANLAASAELLHKAAAYEAKLNARVLELEAENAELKKCYSVLQDRISELCKQRDACKDEARVARDSRDEMERGVGELQAKIVELAGQRDGYKVACRNAEEKVGNLVRKLGDLQAKLPKMNSEIAILEEVRQALNGSEGTRGKGVWASAEASRVNGMRKHVDDTFGECGALKAEVARLEKERDAYREVAIKQGRHVASATERLKDEAAEMAALRADVKAMAGYKQRFNDLTRHLQSALQGKLPENESVHMYAGDVLALYCDREALHRRALALEEQLVAKQGPVTTPPCDGDCAPPGALSPKLRYVRNVDVSNALMVVKNGYVLGPPLANVYHTAAQLYTMNVVGIYEVPGEKK